MPGDNEFWIGPAEVVRLFPTFLWRCQLRPEVYGPINVAILSRLDAMRQNLPPLHRGEAWQSGHGLHKLEEFSDLVSVIGTAAETVLAFLHIDLRDVRVTGCWANVNAPGATHRMHTHPNNFLSGVYYVHVDEDSSTINFHDPRPEAGIIRPPVTELSAYNTDQVVVTVSTGSLIIFPAWLPHSVDANRSLRPRVSISFNLMFSAFAERMGEPLWGEQ